MRRGCVGAAGLAALALLGCAGGPWPGLGPRLPACPGPLADPAGLGPDTTWHERVRVRGEGVDSGFLLVTEKRGDALVQVAIGRLGAASFALRQEGGAVTVEQRATPGFPVPPETVLADWHRVHAWGLGERLAPDTLRVRPPGCAHETLFVDLAGGAP